MLKLNSGRIRWLLHRATGGRSFDLQSISTHTELICPAEDFKVEPAVFFPEDVARITQVCDHRDKETEQILLYGGTIRHGASLAYHLRDTIIDGLCAYSKENKHRFGYGSDTILLRSIDERRHYKQAALVGTFSGNHYFGTFMMNDIPLSLLPGEDAARISGTPNNYHHERDYRDILDFSAGITGVNSTVDDLIIYSDASQSRSKQARYEKIRSAVKNRYPLKSNDSAGIYIRRGSTGSLRLLVNEAEVEKCLSEFGIQVIDPSQITAEQIIIKGLNSKLVIGVEGSHLSHGIYTIHESGCFLVLQPPDRFSLAYKDYTDRMSMKFAFLVGYQCEGGFKIELSALRAMMHRLQS